jgi:hypothetical protein
MIVTMAWFPAPELVPFGEAVVARGEWTPDRGGFGKPYGIPLTSAAPYEQEHGLLSLPQQRR